MGDVTTVMSAWLAFSMVVAPITGKALQSLSDIAKPTPPQNPDGEDRETDEREWHPFAFRR